MFVKLVLFFVFSTFLLAASSPQSALSNKDVLLMSHSGLTDDVILGKVRNSTCDFESNALGVLRHRSFNSPINSHAALALLFEFRVGESLKVIALKEIVRFWFVSEHVLYSSGLERQTLFLGTVRLPG
jgi:hypothetical protein